MSTQTLTMTFPDNFIIGTQRVAIEWSFNPEPYTLIVFISKNPQFSGPYNIKVLPLTGIMPCIASDSTRWYISSDTIDVTSATIGSAPQRSLLFDNDDYCKPNAK